MVRNNIKIILASALLVSACAPKVQDRQFKPPQTSFGPRFEDVDLSHDLKQSDVFVADMSWKGRVTTSTFFHQAQHLVRLGELTSNASLGAKALGWVKAFYSNSRTTSAMDFAQSPFASLATTQTQEEVQKSLVEISDDLQRARLLVKTKVVEYGKKYTWNTSKQNLLKVLDQAEDFTKYLTKNLGSFGMTKQIEDGVREELVKQTRSLFTDLRALAPEFYTTKSFSRSLQLIEDALVKFQIPMPAELAPSFAQGKALASELDKMDDPQGALTVLVDVWKILDTKEREENFRPANESLFDFLSKQDNDSLSCLRKPGCNGGIFKGIAKKLFILPKLDKYGVGKLKQDLNQKTLSYVISEVETFAQRFMTSLPQTFADQIEQGLAKKAEELKTVQTTYPDYLKNLLGKWSKKSLGKTQGQVPGFEISTIDINVSEKSALSLNPVGDLLNLNSSTAGASIAMNALLMDYLSSDDSLGMQRALSQVNKLITVGGYRDDQNKLVPALLSPVESVRSPLDIMNFSESTSHISYRIPDRIKLLDSFHADDKTTYDKSFSAAGFAEQIEGLSRMLRQTADWKHTGFDSLLGKVQAQELSDEIQAEALQRPLFPKDSFFALNLGDVAVLLKDITKKATPVFLVTLNKNIIWADQYDSHGSETAIMAGIVDIVDGKKSNVVQSRDVAKFLLSLAEFLNATDGAENTKSSLLLEKDKNGQSPIDALKEGRADVKLLVVALANFISNQLANEKSLIQSQYYLQELQRSNNPSFDVEVQAYSIRALLAAYEITHIEAYLISAQEIYYSMNRQLFNQQSHFYVNGDGKDLEVPEKVHTLLALQELKPFLPEASQLQLEKISAPWIKALQKLQ